MGEIRAFKKKKKKSECIFKPLTNTAKALLLSSDVKKPTFCNLASLIGEGCDAFQFAINYNMAIE